MTVTMLDLAAQMRVLEPGMREALDRVLRHGRFVLGPEVVEVESELAAYTGAAGVVSCANGTDALVLALRALNLQPGDRVVVPAFTFAATAGAVVLAGGRPVFADIRPDTFNLDVEAVDDQVGALSGPEPVGVIVVDLFGHPADHDALAKLAARRGWWVITDAAQSFGSSLHGTRAGSLGTLATTSFFPAKPLGCFGDGGAVFCPADDHVEMLRSLRNHGAGADRYENVRVGTNSRLDTIQAAVLLQKLRVFDEELARRQELAARYGAALGGAGVTAPLVVEGAISAWSVYTIRVPNRPAVVVALESAGVQHAVYYHSTVADQAAYAAYESLGDLPAARTACHEVISLPVHPYLTRADQDRVIEAVLAGIDRQ
jgi:dTDP-4-amino-4,6-dideoxygalactose transaminase